MFNSPFTDFVNVRSEGNCKYSLLIRHTQLALSALYNIDFLLLI
jgi:hypothetical protein